MKRIVVVPDEECYDDIRTAIRHAGQQEQTGEKRITLMAMQPMPGGTFFQEILGYSLMSALGIKSEEIPQ